jgi:hypothetical protein
MATTATTYEHQLGTESTPESTSASTPSTGHRDRHTTRTFVCECGTERGSLATQTSGPVKPNWQCPVSTPAMPACIIVPNPVPMPVFVPGLHYYTRSCPVCPLFRFPVIDNLIIPPSSPSCTFFLSRCFSCVYYRPRSHSLSRSSLLLVSFIELLLAIPSALPAYISYT